MKDRSSLPLLRIRADVLDRVRDGHPWIYADALLDRASGADNARISRDGTGSSTPRNAPGSWIDVAGPTGGPIARGYHDPSSPIRVRILALAAADGTIEPLDGLVARRLRASMDARRWLYASGATNAMRLVHGEGDHLPGVVCDLYDDTAVVVFDGPGARAALLDDVVATLVDSSSGGPLPPIRRIYERTQRRNRAALSTQKPASAPKLADSSPRAGATKDSGATGDTNGGSEVHSVAAEAGVLWGDPPPERIVVVEHGARFEVDVRHGQKTGLFLDQRDNRSRVAAVSAGARVLNLFCYTGGFSVRAALAGAAHVTSVDLAKPAVDAARRNFELNGLDPGDHAFVAEDAFALLERSRGDGRSARQRWDVVVVDPPSFAPRQSALGSALESYRKLNAAALEVVEPGGLLATASCSSHVTPDAFIGVVREAARRTGRRVRLLDIRGAGEDHPVAPAFVEGRYLKFLLAAVD